MNALEHIKMMEKLNADPGSDASLFLKRNLLTPLSLWLGPLSYLVSFSFCSEEKRCQKSPFCFLSLVNLSVYPSWWSFLKSTDHQLSFVFGQHSMLLWKAHALKAKICFTVKWKLQVSSCYTLFKNALSIFHSLVLWRVLLCYVFGNVTDTDEKDLFPHIQAPYAQLLLPWDAELITESITKL